MTYSAGYSKKLHRARNNPHSRYQKIKDYKTHLISYTGQHALIQGILRMKKVPAGTSTSRKTREP